MNEKNIKTVKLITGEELLAEVNINFERDSVELTEPVVIKLVPSMSGEARIMVMPFPMGSADKVISIRGAHIIYTANPSPELLEQYKQLFSNIITPKQSSLIV